MHPYMPQQPFFPPMPNYAGFGPRPYRFPGGNRMPSKPRSDLACYFCKEKGHLVASCPKMKKQ